jgi:hypothetical protein
MRAVSPSKNQDSHFEYYLKYNYWTRAAYGVNGTTSVLEEVDLFAR